MKNIKTHWVYIVALILLSLGSTFAMKSEIDSTSQLELTRAYYDSIVEQRTKQIEKYEEALITVANHPLMMADELDPRLECADKNLKAEIGWVLENCEETYKSFIKAK